jgi:acetoin utilization deacetylase AcuC-like enzyme
MTENRCGLIYDPVFADHTTGQGHPEQPKRVTHTYDMLRQQGLTEKCVPIEAKVCDEKNLKLVHSPTYLEIAKQDVESGETSLSTGDTQICEDSWDVSLRATGGLLHAIDQIFTGRIERAFSLSRPPGHHASPSKGMGFCLFNHIAIAARYAQEKYKVGKVLIVDWDVHHGNGTQDAFYEDESVFFFSTHQSPWYPGTGSADEKGRGNALGTTMNIPLPAGSGRKEVVEEAFGQDLDKKISSFNPELILISAGFDSRSNDPLGQFTLNDDDFFDLTKMLMDASKKFCNGHLLSVLEGGYNLEGLAKACTSHLKALTE